MITKVEKSRAVGKFEFELSECRTGIERKGEWKTSERDCWSQN